MEGGNLNVVGVDQVVSGIVSAVENTGDAVGRLCLRVVLIGWIPARRIRIESLPGVGVWVRRGHGEEPMVPWDGEEGGVQVFNPPQ